MMPLSRKVEYSLLALFYMVQHYKKNVPITAKEISDHYHIPFEMVARCLQLLARDHVVESMTGALGGYRLCAQWDQISLWELYEIIEGPLNLVRCLEADQSCAYQMSCDLIAPMEILNQKIKNFYQDIKLGALLINKVKKIEKEGHGRYEQKPING